MLFRSVIDIALSGLSIAVMVYVTFNYQAMYYRVGFDPATLDWVFGLIAVVTVLEMTRRLMGLFFPIMAIGFILYAIFGGALPGIFGHRGYELTRTMSTIFSTEGLYGSAMSAAVIPLLPIMSLGRSPRKPPNSERHCAVICIACWLSSGPPYWSCGFSP